jgi:endonuclease YncB( thermonuclease family)
MRNLSQFTGGKQRRARPAKPRRTWHGADRECGLLERNKRGLGRLRISRLELGTTLLAGLFVGLVAAQIDWPQTSGAQSGSAHARIVSASRAGTQFGFCHVGGGINCVVDGDTIWMDGVKIRIADIDTPETHPPRCAAEADLGGRATRRLQDLLNAGPVTLEPIERDEDRYGRKLRRIMRGGKSLGETLVAEGLARSYRGGPRSGWCD